jgi:hypothetical protein
MTLTNSPVTPPNSTSMYTSRQPPVRHDAPTSPLKQPLQEDTPYAVDWLDFTRTRSARFIAEKTCEMICYLWFSRTSPTSSPYHSSQDTSAYTALQFVASPTFVSFMQKVLETTQVSESVIVLSLYYIHRLKEVSHWFTSGQQGSEFRIAVAALMMANKFLDEYVRIYFYHLRVSNVFLATRTRIRHGRKSQVSNSMRSIGWSGSF